MVLRTGEGGREGGREGGSGYHLVVLDTCSSVNYTPTCSNQSTLWPGPAPPPPPPTLYMLRNASAVILTGKAWE